MRCRVKDGAAYRDKAGTHHEAGAHVEVDEHEAAVIPWCLERVETPVDDGETSRSAVVEIDEPKSTKRPKSTKQDK